MIKHLPPTIKASHSPRRVRQGLLALALMAASLPAWALGLGQIQVKSQRDQPLLAEIPIISSDPSELEALQARLASPETFARVGLASPQGLVQNLQFNVALDANGRPVIRVTSAEPVQQPIVTFLVEVDWGQGRLVREYSALLDTPQTAAAPLQPPIEEATVSPNTVVRPVEAPEAAVAASEPLPTPVAPTPAPTPAPGPVAPTPAPAPVVQAPAPQPAAPLALGQTRTVQRGDTLAGIAGEVAQGYSLEQTMVALLRANPEAFIGGNINRLKAGAVLRVPDGGTLASTDADEAVRVVAEQVAQWRGDRAVMAQPPALAGAGATAPARRESTDAAPAPAPRRTEARLEIAPPSAADAARAGTRSGVSAGGEGDMLREQELIETKETLASREAEVQELKARVAELEQLQKQQQELLAMKDTELATVQQRLANAPEQGGANAWPWIGGGAGLIALALALWWWLSRRAPTPAPARGRDTARLAAAVPGRTEESPEPDAPAWARGAPPAAPEPPKPVTDTPSGMPAWVAGAAAPAADVAPEPAPAPAPADAHDPPGADRLDLARAYIDMGDKETARIVLQEVAAHGDSAVVRHEALRMLGELR